MKRIFLDIETLPTKDANREFVGKKLRRSLAKKCEIASEADFDRKAEIAFRDTALSGSLGRLLCVGLMVDANGKAGKPCVCGQDKDTKKFHLDEAKTLCQFWNHLDRINFDADCDLVVGHNILGFDLPFLYHRSMVCGVEPTRNLLSGKPWEIAVYDTMEKWQMGKYYEKIGLEELALAFGLNCPKNGAVSAENLAEAFRTGQHQEIREYCLADVHCARELYYRMTFQKMPSGFSLEKSANLALAV